MEVLREVSAGCRCDQYHGCFNPCFDGSVERGPKSVAGLKAVFLLVSILVLMEVLREGHNPRSQCNGTVYVSILVLMEVLREEEKKIWLPSNIPMFQSLF